MVYRPAYWPRLNPVVLEIQNEFMKGIEMISPRVTIIMEKTAVMTEAGSRFSNIQETPTVAAPQDM